MPAPFDTMFAPPEPTAERPLLGLTVLVVEDSRFASEAMRLLCLRSGARIRRADSLTSARKHLRVYRPAVVIVDLGLPDGSGTELIAELTNAVPRVGAVLAMSGDTGVEAAARAAGADAFIAKPITGLAAFQSIILEAFPAHARPKGLSVVSDAVVTPDPIALQDDLVHVADILTTQTSDDVLDYIAQFLAGIARSVEDEEMAEAAVSLASRRQNGLPQGADVARVSGLVQARIAPGRVL